MDTIGFYTDLGFWHVLDLAGLDHLYFITALALPFGFKESKKLIWWVTLFTLGHTLSLIGNFYVGMIFSVYWIELFIPITIALSTLSLLFQNKTIRLYAHDYFFSALTVLFGIIHGLGFGRYFNMLIPDDAVGLSLFSFALGVELAQLVIVLAILLLNWGVVRVLKKSRKKWEFLMGAILLSLALVMIFERI
jgi:hydrogenase/urease accessory protein HupE